MPINQKDEITGYYTHLAPKFSWLKFSYVPQGVKWVGPRELDTQENRDEFLKYAQRTNPYLKKIRWFEPPYTPSPTATDLRNAVQDSRQSPHR